jgi:hypothetical protein
MSELDKADFGHSATDKELSTALNACGNCGRRIQAHQKYLEIYNTRHKGYEHYHESYLGCYESTRESGRRAILNRWKRYVDLEQYDLDGSVRVSTGWQL